MLQLLCTALRQLAETDGVWIWFGTGILDQPRALAARLKMAVWVAAGEKTSTQASFLAESVEATPPRRLRVQHLQSTEQSWTPPAVPKPQQHSQAMAFAAKVNQLGTELSGDSSSSLQQAETPPRTPPRPNNFQQLQNLFGESGMPSAPKRRVRSAEMNTFVFPTVPALPASR